MSTGLPVQRQTVIRTAERIGQNQTGSVTVGGFRPWGIVPVAEILYRALVCRDEGQALTSIGQPGVIGKFPDDPCRGIPAITELEGHGVPDQETALSWLQSRNRGPGKFKLEARDELKSGERERPLPDVEEFEIFKRVRVVVAILQLLCAGIRRVVHDLRDHQIGSARDLIGHHERYCFRSAPDPIMIRSSGYDLGGIDHKRRGRDDVGYAQFGSNQEITLIDVGIKRVQGNHVGSIAQMLSCKGEVQDLRQMKHGGVPAGTFGIGRSGAVPCHCGGLQQVANLHSIQVGHESGIAVDG